MIGENSCGVGMRFVLSLVVRAESETLPALQV